MRLIVKYYVKLMSQIWNFMSMEYVGLAIGVISVVLSCICYLIGCPVLCS